MRLLARHTTPTSRGPFWWACVNLHRLDRLGYDLDREPAKLRCDGDKKIHCTTKIPLGSAMVGCFGFVH